MRVLRQATLDLTKRKPKTIPKRMPAANLQFPSNANGCMFVLTLFVSLQLRCVILPTAGHWSLRDCHCFLRKRHYSLASVIDPCGIVIVPTARHWALRACYYPIPLAFRFRIFWILRK